MDVLAKIRELAEHEELSAFDASGTPVSSALRMAAAEIERLRTALNTARNYIEDEPMVANAVVVREGETVSRDTISAGKHPTLLQVIDDALGINEQSVEEAK